MKFILASRLAVIVLVGFGSFAESAIPAHFEIEAGIVVGTNEIDRFRGDGMTVAGLRSRAGKSASNSIIGLTCFPDGSDKKFTMFDVLAGGKLTTTAKSYGGRENSSLQELCLAHHVKYLGR